MLYDHIEIVFDLMRSRMKRIISIINDMIVDTKVDEERITNKYLKKKVKKFHEANTNYFDKQFTVRSANKWVKLIDYNLEGTERYANQFPDYCLSS